MPQPSSRRLWYATPRPLVSNLDWTARLANDLSAVASGDPQERDVRFVD